MTAGYESFVQSFVGGLQEDLERIKEEQAKITARFNAAAAMAEDAFLVELTKLVSRMTRQLREGKQFKSALVTGLTDYFERFRRLSVTSSSELDELVNQAQNAIRGVASDGLGGEANEAFRAQLHDSFSQVESGLTELMERRPTRSIILQPEEDDE